MFSGIIEGIGTVTDAALTPSGEYLNLALAVPDAFLEGVAFGDSIAVNGVCLTVVEFSTEPGAAFFRADVMKETLDHTNLGELVVGTKVNLERALPAGGRLNGHIVQGHVDTTTTLKEIIPGEKWSVYTFELPDSIRQYVVHKGSITINGTSLTVSAVEDGTFSVSLIPTTMAETILGELTPGARVNIEVDILAKYIERLLESKN
ncbi:MAG: riboflavin synthase [Corynebacterium sp.]|nr:riboflavin synthase [Corynebacterium sp.]